MRVDDVFNLKSLAFTILIISPALKLESTTAASPAVLVRHYVGEVVAVLLNLLEKHFCNLKI